MSWLLYLAFILYVSAFCRVGTATQTNEAQVLTDMSKKVNDIWYTLLFGIPIKNDSDNNTYGICNLNPNPKLNGSEAKITGEVLFRQSYPNGKLEAYFFIQGFPLDSNQSCRAIHIHSFGDVSNGCDSTGGHYNPLNVNHPKHLGDFGNFKVQDGKIRQHLSNLAATFFGPYSVYGKSIVVHKMADDLGRGGNQASLENGNAGTRLACCASLENGNAGTRLACCVIGFATNNSWDKYMQENAKLKSPRVSRRVSNVRKVKN
ncbi:Superoxide dismutase [Pristimantis euphronides]